MQLRPRRLGAVLFSITCLVGLGSAGAADAVTMTQRFGATQSAQAFDVPPGVTEVDVTAIGGRGGDGGGAGAGGYGARVTGTLAVTPQTRLWVLTGSNGGVGAAAHGANGAWNGGGDGGTGDYFYRGGGGGGASDVRACDPSVGCSDDDPGWASDPLGRLLIAGGGGGAARAAGSRTGSGGNATAPGESVETPGFWLAGGGGGGTASAGGAAGVTGNPGPDPEGAPLPAEPGRLLHGGTGGTGRSHNLIGGGGGGGGRYGGGGGGSANDYAGGGGGGSNLVPVGGSAETDATGRPSVTLSWEPGPPATIDQPRLSPSSVYANGTSQTTVTVVVRDDDGAAVRGADVSFSATELPGTASAPQIGPTTDNADGSYSATVTGTATRGVSSITARLAAAERTSEPVTLQQVDRPTVTSPAGDTHVAEARAAGAPVTVSGTADPLTSGVNLSCVGRTSVRPLPTAQAVPVTDGRWSVSNAALPPNQSHEPHCRIVATAADVQAISSETAAQPGPSVRRLTMSTDLSGNVFYRADAAGLDGELDLESLGYGCGVKMRLVAGLRYTRGPLSLECGALLPAANRTIDGEGSIVVDGRAAYVAANAININGVGGAPTVTISAIATDDGSFVITERGPAHRCSATDLPTRSAAACGTLVDTGVTVESRTRISPSGTSVSSTFDFASTDGAAHDVQMTLESTGGYGNPQSRVGDETTWQARAAPERSDVATPQLSVLLRDEQQDDVPALAVTAVPGPSTQIVHGNRLLQRFTRSVPAAGRAGVALNFDLTARDEIEAAATAARDRYAVGVEVAAPTGGTSTEAETVTLTGTAFDRSGAVALRVAGEPAAVAEDGSWTAAVPLSAGENTIEAVVTSNYGMQETASVTVTRTVPVPPADPDPPTPPTDPKPPIGTTPPPPPGPSLPWSPAPPGSPAPPSGPAPSADKPRLLRRVNAPKSARLATIRKRGLAIRLTLRSPRTRITAEIRGPWGRLARSVRRPAKAGTTVVRLKPSRRAAAQASRALRRTKTVKLRLKLTVRDAQGATQTITRTIRLRR